MEDRHTQALEKAQASSKDWESRYNDQVLSLQQTMAFVANGGKPELGKHFNQVSRGKFRLDADGTMQPYEGATGQDGKPIQDVSELIKQLKDSPEFGIYFNAENQSNGAPPPGREPETSEGFNLPEGIRLS